MTITGRHALVTGASRGIALKLAEDGVHVAINYLKELRGINLTYVEPFNQSQQLLAPCGSIHPKTHQ